ncbi:MAG: hypothetical protein ACTSPF_09425 [Candidatus Heimdallarchaeaceae archaeon]
MPFRRSEINPLVAIIIYDLIGNNKRMKLKNQKFIVISFIQLNFTSGLEDIMK